MCKPDCTNYFIWSAPLITRRCFLASFFYIFIYCCKPDTRPGHFNYRQKSIAIHANDHLRLITVNTLVRLYVSLRRYAINGAIHCRSTPRHPFYAFDPRPGIAGRRHYGYDPRRVLAGPVHHSRAGDSIIEIQEAPGLKGLLSNQRFHTGQISEYDNLIPIGRLVYCYFIKYQTAKRETDNA